MKGRERETNSGGLGDDESWMNASIRIGRSESNKTVSVQPIAPPDDNDTASSSECSPTLAEAGEVIHNAEIVDHVEDKAVGHGAQNPLTSESDDSRQSPLNSQNVDGTGPEVSRKSYLRNRDQNYLNNATSPFIIFSHSGHGVVYLFVGTVLQWWKGDPEKTYQ